jgi:hypothetical protein
LYPTQEPSPLSSSKSSATSQTTTVTDTKEEKDASGRKVGRILLVADSDGSTIPVDAAVSTTPKGTISHARHKPLPKEKPHKKTTTVAKPVVKLAAKPAVASAKSNNSTRCTRRSGGQVELLAGIEYLPVTKKTAPKRKFRDDGNVTKVKMLTGTLYLYKGKRPFRAEFVRSK